MQSSTVNSLLFLLSSSIFLLSSSCYGFLLPSSILSSQQQKYRYNYVQQQQPQQQQSSSALNVWWFGGTSDEATADDISCELVPVRIERTSANSRKIAGEITVDAPLSDVWAILTDYNRLSTHVPNLIQSKIMVPGTVGEPGDGQYQCRLYQQGAQKIVGFQFGADVTMQMTEKIIVDAPHQNADPDIPALPQQRQIGFKCVDSFFFSEFDGFWIVSEEEENEGSGTKLTYIVDVRPKGPVPVAALEWRIREDVPTNLRAVKQAALKVGHAGVSQFRQKRQRFTQNVKRVLQRPLTPEWSENETMAAYLK
mmetsp:Transcript_30810/g.45563  ORF Transcript_30810/g.45563 Transcript_30810/m.45563 type:complete len:310 (+) Transcript_30810:333-1262(+)|eukprot:CAMPEP_0194211444 /NCGR_PEP_ID=MMETSP0156-20130528/10257_1 /TAXON_ID=33649 /ORGANISM="Thalassionema nitzschioides, Strain L26-B" /LENGTH=309 /DNA_ID=CAMNT_0038938987 /DNA_START=311 /DNA_END=1243 /DNA_ORIENTATION=-